jgi:hypothetical protein
MSYEDPTPQGIRETIETFDLLSRLMPDPGKFAAMAAQLRAVGITLHGAPVAFQALELMANEGNRGAEVLRANLRQAVPRQPQAAPLDSSFLRRTWRKFWFTAQKP